MLDSALITRLKSAAEALFRDSRMLAAYAYGSRVSGAPRFDSDLDIGYYLDGDPGADVLSIRDEMWLAGQLSDAAGLTVDLRNLAGAPLELRGRVIEEGVRIFSGDPAARVALERELLARYHDYKDIFRQMHELRLRTVHERGI